MIYFSFHIGDWETGTRLLSAAEKGIYIDLLTLYYKQEGPIMQMQCKRIARAYDLQEQEALEYVLATFFTLDGDCYRNDRADEEIEKYRATIDGRRKAAQSRWNKAKSEVTKGQEDAKSKQSDCKNDAIAYANALQVDMQTGMQTACKKDAIQYPITNSINNTNKHISHKETVEPPAAVDVCPVDDFEEDEEPPFDIDPKPAQNAMPSVSGMFQTFGQNPVRARDSWEDESGQDFDAPLPQQIDDCHLRNNQEALKDDGHILTASQIVVLIGTLGTKIGHSARLDEIAARKTLTVGMVKKIVEDWKATRTGVGYLMGYLDNVSANPSQLHGKRKEREINAETISNGQCYAFAKKLGHYHPFASTNTAYLGETMEAFIERVAERLKDPDYFEHCRPYLIRCGAIKETQA